MKKEEWSIHICLSPKTSDNRLHCVFHSIRFKVNKGWSKALLLFLCLYA